MRQTHRRYRLSPRGRQFHHADAPVGMVPDMVCDNTKLPEKLITKDYLADAEVMSLKLKELYVT